MLSKKIEGKGTRGWILHSWKLSCLLPIFSSKQERGRHNAKDETKEFTYLQCAFRHFDFSGRRMNMMQHKTANSVILFSGSHAFGPWGDISKVSIIKRKQKLEGNCSSKSNSPSIKHSEGTRGTGKIPNPMQGCIVCHDNLQWKSSGCHEISCYASIESEYSIIKAE